MLKKKITINDQEVRILEIENEDYFCITDIAKSGKGRPALIIQNYLRNKNTVAFLGMWEQMHNPDFKVFEFEDIKNETGMNNFSLSASEWIEKTNANGMVVKKGRNGGLFCHKDITIHFTTWFSVPFYLFLIKEFQFLSEAKQKSLHFYLNKIFNNTLEANQISKFLLDGQDFQNDKK